MNHFTKAITTQDAMENLCFPVPHSEISQSRASLCSYKSKIHFSLENIKRIFSSGLKRKMNPRKKFRTFVKKRMLNLAIKELKKAHSHSSVKKAGGNSSKNSATTSEGAMNLSRVNVNLADSTLPNLKGLFIKLKEVRETKMAKLKPLGCYNDFRDLVKRSHQIDDDIEDNFFKVDDVIDAIGERVEFSLVNQDGLDEESFL